MTYKPHFFVCLSGYYKLFGICIFLNGIFLHLSRSYISSAALPGSLHSRRQTFSPSAFIFSQIWVKAGAASLRCWETPSATDSVLSW